LAQTATGHAALLTHTPAVRHPRRPIRVAERSGRDRRVSLLP
jgi:hypothetical protein